MTYNEKLKMVQDIKILPSEYLRGVWELINEQSIEYGGQIENLEFNIDLLTNRKCRELEKYLRIKISFLKKSKKRKLKKILKIK